MTSYLDTSYNWTDPTLVSVYDEMPLWSAMFGALLFKHVPLQPGIQVLDLACGTGFPLIELAQVLWEGCRVIGLDPWREALDRAHMKTRTLELRNVDIIQGSGERMPFPDGRFDLIVSNLGMNNFDRLAEVFAECFRVMRAGGRVALTSNIKGHMQEFYEVFAETLKETGHADRLPALVQHIDHRVTVPNACHILKEAGFRIAHVFEESYQMRFISGSAFLRHSFIKMGFLEGWRNVVGPEREVEVFTRLEENLNQLTKEQGELVLTIPMAYIEVRKLKIENRE